MMMSSNEDDPEDNAAQQILEGMNDNLIRKVWENLPKNVKDGIKDPNPMEAIMNRMKSSIKDVGPDFSTYSFPANSSSTSDINVDGLIEKANNYIKKIGTSELLPMPRKKPTFQNSSKSMGSEMARYSTSPIIGFTKYTQNPNQFVPSASSTDQSLALSRVKNPNKPDKPGTPTKPPVVTEVPIMPDICFETIQKLRITEIFEPKVQKYSNAISKLLAEVDGHSVQLEQCMNHKKTLIASIAKMHVKALNMCKNVHQMESDITKIKMQVCGTYVFKTGENNGPCGNFCCKGVINKIIDLQEKLEKVQSRAMLKGCFLAMCQASEERIQTENTLLKKDIKHAGKIYKELFCELQQIRKVVCKLKPTNPPSKPPTPKDKRSELRRRELPNPFKTVSKWHDANGRQTNNSEGSWYFSGVSSGEDDDEILVLENDNSDLNPSNSDEFLRQVNKALAESSEQSDVESFLNKAQSRKRAGSESSGDSIQSPSKHSFGNHPPNQHVLMNSTSNEEIRMVSFTITTSSSHRSSKSPEAHKDQSSRKQTTEETKRKAGQEPFTSTPTNKRRSRKVAVKREICECGEIILGPRCSCGKKSRRNAPVNREDPVSDAESANSCLMSVTNYNDSEAHQTYPTSIPYRSDKKKAYVVKPLSPNRRNSRNAKNFEHPPIIIKKDPKGVTGKQEKKNSLDKKRHAVENVKKVPAGETSKIDPAMFVKPRETSPPVKLSKKKVIKSIEPSTVCVCTGIPGPCECSRCFCDASKDSSQKKQTLKDKNEDYKSFENQPKRKSTSKMAVCICCDGKGNKSCQCPNCDCEKSSMKRYYHTPRNDSRSLQRENLQGKKALKNKCICTGKEGSCGCPNCSCQSVVTEKKVEEKSINNAEKVSKDKARFGKKGKSEKGPCICYDNSRKRPCACPECTCDKTDKIDTPYNISRESIPRTDPNKKSIRNLCICTGIEGPCECPNCSCQSMVAEREETILDEKSSKKLLRDKSKGSVKEKFQSKACICDGKKRNDPCKCPKCTCERIKPDQSDIFDDFPPETGKQKDRNEKSLRNVCICTGKEGPCDCPNCSCQSIQGSEQRPTQYNTEDECSKTSPQTTTPKASQKSSRVIKKDEMDSEKQTGQCICKKGSKQEVCRCPDCTCEKMIAPEDHSTTTRSTKRKKSNKSFSQKEESIERSEPSLAEPESICICTSEEGPCQCPSYTCSEPSQISKENDRTRAEVDIPGKSTGSRSRETSKPSSKSSVNKTFESRSSRSSSCTCSVCPLKTLQDENHFSETVIPKTPSGKEGKEDESRRESHFSETQIPKKPSRKVEKDEHSKRGSEKVEQDYESGRESKKSHFSETQIPKKPSRKVEKDEQRKRGSEKVEKGYESGRESKEFHFSETQIPKRPSRKVEKDEQSTRGSEKVERDDESGRESKKSEEASTLGDKKHPSSTNEPSKKPPLVSSSEQSEKDEPKPKSSKLRESITTPKKERSQTPSRKRDKSPVWSEKSKKKPSKPITPERSPKESIKRGDKSSSRNVTANEKDDQKRYSYKSTESTRDTSRASTTEESQDEKEIFSSDLQKDSLLQPGKDLSRTPSGLRENSPTRSEKKQKRPSRRASREQILKDPSIKEKKSSTGQILKKSDEHFETPRRSENNNQAPEKDSRLSSEEPDIGHDRKDESISRTSTDKSAGSHQGIIHEIVPQDPLVYYSDDEAENKSTKIILDKKQTESATSVPKKSQTDPESRGKGPSSTYEVIVTEKGDWQTDLLEKKQKSKTFDVVKEPLDRKNSKLTVEQEGENKVYETPRESKSRVELEKRNSLKAPETPNRKYETAKTPKEPPRTPKEPPRTSKEPPWTPKEPPSTPKEPPRTQKEPPRTPKEPSRVPSFAPNDEKKGKINEKDGSLPYEKHSSRKPSSVPIKPPAEIERSGSHLKDKRSKQELKDRSRQPSIREKQSGTRQEEIIYDKSQGKIQTEKPFHRPSSKYDEKPTDERPKAPPPSRKPSSIFRQEISENPDKPLSRKPSFHSEKQEKPIKDYDKNLSRRSSKTASIRFETDPESKRKDEDIIDKNKKYDSRKPTKVPSKTEPDSILPQDQPSNASILRVVRDCQEKLRECQAENEQLEFQRKSTATQIQRLQTDLDNCQKTYEDCLAGKISDRNVLKQISSLQNENTRLNQEVDKMKIASNKLGITNDLLKEENDKLKAELQQKLTDGNNAPMLDCLPFIQKIAKLESQIVAINLENEDIRKENADCNSKLAKAQDDYSKYLKELGKQPQDYSEDIVRPNQTSDCKQWIELANKLEAKLKDYRVRSVKSAFLAEISAKQRDELKNEVKELKSNLVKCQEDLRKCSAENATTPLQNQIHEMQEELAKYQDAVSQYEESNSRLLREKEEAVNELEAVEYKLKKCEEEIQNILKGDDSYIGQQYSKLRTENNELIVEVDNKKREIERLLLNVDWCNKRWAECKSKLEVCEARFGSAIPEHKDDPSYVEDTIRDSKDTDENGPFTHKIIPFDPQDRPSKSLPAEEKVHIEKRITQIIEKDTNIAAEANLSEPNKRASKSLSVERHADLEREIKEHFKDVELSKKMYKFLQSQLQKVIHKLNCIPCCENVQDELVKIYLAIDWIKTRICRCYPDPRECCFTPKCVEGSDPILHAICLQIVVGGVRSLNLRQLIYMHCSIYKVGAEFAKTNCFRFHCKQFTVSKHGGYDKDKRRKKKMAMKKLKRLEKEMDNTRKLLYNLKDFCKSQPNSCLPT